MQLACTDLNEPSETEERAALERCQRGDAQAFGGVILFVSVLREELLFREATATCTKVGSSA